MINNYAKAYVEILEILNYIPKKEYNKIDKNMIKFFEEKKDNDYIFNYDFTKSFENQDIMKETNIILISLYEKYFANDEQKSKLNEILKNNYKEKQDKLNEKYDVNKLFVNYNESKNEDVYLQEIKKDNIFMKIIKYIKNIIKR